MFSPASYSRIKPCFTAGKRIGVWNCHAACRRRKTTVFTTIVNASLSGNLAMLLEKWRSKWRHDEHLTLNLFSTNKMININLRIVQCKIKLLRVHHCLHCKRSWSCKVEVVSPVSNEKKKVMKKNWFQSETNRGIGPDGTRLTHLAEVYEAPDWPPSRTHYLAWSCTPVLTRALASSPGPIFILFYFNFVNRLKWFRLDHATFGILLQTTGSKDSVKKWVLTRVRNQLTVKKIINKK